MNYTDQLTDLINQVLEHLQHPAETSVEFDDSSGYYHIQIQTEQPGLLIGYRGETLSSLQFILGMMANKLTQEEDERIKLIVNVNDYRERREATLAQLAKNAAQKVKFSGEPYYFDRLTPAERRVVHMALKDDPEINTYSEGEGRNRCLVIATK